MPTTILITGGNRGIGLEAVTQFAATGKFDKVILTVRSPNLGPAAVAAAAEISGQPTTRFAFEALNLESHTSVREAVKALPRLDAIVCNAGGLGGEALTSHGVTQNLAGNTLGHVVLVEGLLAAGKIRPGARVVYSHSETTRSVWLFAGFQPFVRLYKEEIAGSLAKPPTRGTLGVAVRQRMNTCACH